MRSVIHLATHFVVPGLAAKLGWRRHWLRAWGILLLVNLIDLDHLLADPIYDPNRCSIGYHPLHTGTAIAIYAVMLVLPGTRLIGVGLLIHIALDAIDCVWMMA